MSLPVAVALGFLLWLTRFGLVVGLDARLGTLTTQEMNTALDQLILALFIWVSGILLGAVSSILANVIYLTTWRLTVGRKT